MCYIETVAYYTIIQRNRVDPLELVSLSGTGQGTVFLTAGGMGYVYEIVHHRMQFLFFDDSLSGVGNTIGMFFEPFEQNAKCYGFHAG